MNFIPHVDSHYQELHHLRVTTQLALPIKVSEAPLMGVRLMGCLIWPQSWDEYYD